MKEQENSPEEELDETEAIYYRVRGMMIRILNSMKKDIETKKGPVRNKECSI